jgi:hypothetical protein
MAVSRRDEEHRLSKKDSWRINIHDHRTTEEMWSKLCVELNCKQIQILVASTPKCGVPEGVASKLSRGGESGHAHPEAPG